MDLSYCAPTLRWTNAEEVVVQQQDDSVAVDRFKRLLRIADATITAGDLIVDQELFSIRPGTPPERARAQLDSKGFDWAPVTDVPIYRYVATSDLTSDVAAVQDASRLLGESHWIDESLPLGEVLELLRTNRFLFVRHHRHTVGILTVADLEQPAVAMFVLGLITSAEAALDVLIERASNGAWLSELSEGHQEKVHEVFRERECRGADLTMIRCLDLAKRVALIKRLKLADELGFASNGAVERWKDEALHVRNVLAHGDTLLTAIPAPADALEFIGRVREFASTAWTQAQNAA